jgi:hypothetical protein
MCGDMSCTAPAYSGSASETMVPGPALQPPTQGGPNFTPPPPTPSSLFNQTSMDGAPQGYYGMQPAGYYPSYPSYPMNPYPVNNYPMVPPMPAPNYWYNGR